MSGCSVDMPECAHADDPCLEVGKRIRSDVQHAPLANDGLRPVNVDHRRGRHVGTGHRRYALDLCVANS